MGAAASAQGQGVEAAGLEVGAGGDGARVGRSFSIADNQFVLDGTPVRLIAGELHYFRIPRAYWRDRLQRLAANGYNAIQTYVPWNYHEEQKGAFDFSGEKDVFAFLEVPLPVTVLESQHSLQSQLHRKPPWLTDTLARSAHFRAVPKRGELS